MVKRVRTKSRLLPTLRALALAGAALALCGAEAVVTDPKFGPYDISTIFFINKSDDKNRVDYGLRLDANCMPVGDDPVFPYWRELENAPPEKTHSLKFFEYAAYGVVGVKSQKTESGADITLKLKPLSRELVVSTGKGPDGKCKAVVRTTIAEVQGAELKSAYIKLKYGWTVEYVDVFGRHPVTGAEITERLRQ